MSSRTEPSLDFRTVSKLASFCGYFISPESGPSGAKAYLRAAVLWPRYEAEAAAAIANTTEVAFAAVLTYKGKVLYLGVSVLS